MSSATIQANIHDYESASKVLGSRDRKKIGNNTYLYKMWDGVLAVKYHATVIAQFTPGHAIYNSGGWHTYTTKDRLNQLLPSGWLLYQQKFEWYVWNHLTQEEFSWYDGVEFIDGKAK